MFLCHPPQDEDLHRSLLTPNGLCGASVLFRYNSSYLSASIKTATISGHENDYSLLWPKHLPEAQIADLAALSSV